MRKKTEKYEIISLSYSFTERDGQFITSGLKNFKNIFNLNYFYATNNLTEKEKHLIRQGVWFFDKFADYLYHRYFSKNKSDDINLIPLCDTHLSPLYKSMESRFCLWFKYYKLIDDPTILYWFRHNKWVDNVTTIDFDPVEWYVEMEFYNMITIVNHYDSFPDNKKGMFTRECERIKFMKGNLKHSDISILQNTSSIPPNEIFLILTLLKRSNNPEHIKDKQIWCATESRASRSRFRGTFAKYYRMLAKGDDVKPPKAGRKYTHNIDCPNCTTLMSIESHHDTYQHRTNYLECPKCGYKEKVKVPIEK